MRMKDNNYCDRSMFAYRKIILKSLNSLYRLPIFSMALKRGLVIQYIIPNCLQIKMYVFSDKVINHVEISAHFKENVIIKSFCIQIYFSPSIDRAKVTSSDLCLYSYATW